MSCARSLIHTSRTLRPLLTIHTLAVLNILVNNSGATWGESLETYPDQAFSKLMTLNVQRVFTLCQKLVPMLKKGAEKNGVGRIINVGRRKVWCAEQRGVDGRSLRTDWKYQW